ncbi:hypothetical protein GCM10010428_41640 [Actinosynnema pretiosum subsp. pretiosum]
MAAPARVTRLMAVLIRSMAKEKTMVLGGVRWVGAVVMGGTLGRGWSGCRARRRRVDLRRRALVLGD